MKRLDKCDGCKIAWHWTEAYVILSAVFGMQMGCIGAVLSPEQVCRSQLICLMLASSSLLLCTVLLTIRLPRLALLPSAILFLLVPFLRQFAGLLLGCGPGLNRWLEVLLPVTCQAAMLVLILLVRSWCATGACAARKAIALLVAVSMAFVVPGVVWPVVLGEPLHSYRIGSLELESPRILSVSPSGELLIISGEEGAFHASVVASEGSALRWHWTLAGTPIGGYVDRDKVRLVLAEPAKDDRVTLAFVESTSSGVLGSRSVECACRLVPYQTNCLSPDGRTVALNGGLMVPFEQAAAPNEGATLESQDEALFSEWRPDSAQAVFCDYTKRELQLLNRDTQARTCHALAFSPSSELGFAVSPGGNQVAYSVGARGLAIQSLKSDEKMALRLPQALAPRADSRLMWIGENEIAYVAARHNLCSIDVLEPRFPRYRSPIYDPVLQACYSTGSGRLYWTTDFAGHASLHAYPRSGIGHCP